MKKLFTYHFIFILLFISCTKEIIIEADTTKPEIKVVYPLDKPIIPAGYPLCMKVLISDNKNLLTVWLEITGGHAFKKEYIIPGRSMEIIEKYTAPAGVSGNLIAKFFAMDEAGNLSSEEIKFSVNN